MNATATIVLPIHNGERTLRCTIESILNLAHGMMDHFEVVVVDDGSTDETFETACELSARYPQLHVIRQPFQRGLGAALDRVRRAFAVTEVIAHDGVGPIDVEELAGMLRQSSRVAKAPSDDLAESRGSRRFAAITALNARMQAAHRSVMGFRRLTLDPGIEPRRRAATPLPLSAGLLNAYGSSLPAHS